MTKILVAVIALAVAGTVGLAAIAGAYAAVAWAVETVR